MKLPAVLLLLGLLFLIKVSNAQTTYTFTGNGNWTVTSNWSNSTIPPAILPSNDTIVINPAAGDSCVLNTSQTMSPGSSLVIAPGANFIIRVGVTINNPTSDSTFTDPRDGQVYTFRHIGTQVWMTKNLNYAAASGSWCYNDNTDSCDIYGRLYDWNTALSVAPHGWHLPSEAEWHSLIDYLGGNEVAGGKMKEAGTTHWFSPNTGADNISGFTGLPAGGHNNTVKTEYPLGYAGYWWSSTSNNTEYGWGYILESVHNHAYPMAIPEIDGISVRCIRDTPTLTRPSITTKEVINLTNTSVRAGGIITADGSSSVTSSGVVWDTIPDPTIALSTKTVNSVTSDTFSTDVIGLKAGTTYYIKAYATNSVGTAYGNEISFTTTDTVYTGLPDIVTRAVINITNTSAISGGIITTNGVSPVTASGLVWDTLPHPTIVLSTKTINDIIADTFSNNITGLRVGITYHVRSYATNSAGTSYGNELSFTTPTDSIFIDPRDGHVYTFRHIGTQVWMTKNLNYAAASGSWCYGNNTDSCAVYGRLYDWNTALTVAPSGWHLPSDAEWQTLIGYLGGSSVAGGKMKEAGMAHWLSPNTGADNSSGFTGLPGGYRVLNAFSNPNNYGCWWSSTESNGTDGWSFMLYYSDANANRVTSDKTVFGFSVRCIRD